MAGMRFTISDPKPITVTSAEMDEREPHPRIGALDHRDALGALLGLLVVPRHHVDGVGGADDEQQRRQDERPERDRAARQHEHAERADERDRAPR